MANQCVRVCVCECVCACASYQVGASSPVEEESIWVNFKGNQGGPVVGLLDNRNSAVSRGYIHIHAHTHYIRLSLSQTYKLR